MKVPKSFEIQGRTIKVASVEEIDGGASFGSWTPDDDAIRIQDDIPRDLRYHTFLHECCHAWMDTLQRPELSKDEDFIDALAGLIHQMLKTSTHG